MQNVIDVIDRIKSDRVINYAIAGLDSYLLGNGKVRYFECSRDHQDQITPHSHRFDFSCIVLAGMVTNRIWVECDDQSGDFFEGSIITYDGVIGEHD